ncbi:MAG: signal peptidase I [Candidatus Kerfeldbacteria bacterium]
MKKTEEKGTGKQKPLISQTRQRTTMGRQQIVPSFSESVVSFIVEVAKVVIISLAIIIPIRYFLIQPFYVKGASMEPNFFDNEYLVVDEISYRFGEPHRGDVVVLRNPRHESDFFIKRVIGLPGERVVITNSTVSIYSTEHPSGKALDESAYLASTVRTSGEEDVTLGPNEYFVLGDNRESSLDSRYFGPITRKEIVGRTWIRAWPVNRMAVFRAPEYPIVNAAPDYGL